MTRTVGDFRRGGLGLAAALLCAAWLSSDAEGAVTRSLQRLSDGRIQVVLTWAPTSARASGMILEEQIPNGWALDVIDVQAGATGFVRRASQTWGIALGVTTTGTVTYVLQPVAVTAEAVVFEGSSKRLETGVVIEEPTGGDCTVMCGPAKGLGPALYITRFDAVAGGELEFVTDASVTGTVFLDSRALSADSQSGWQCVGAGVSSQIFECSQTNRLTFSGPWSEAGAMFRLRVCPD